jgi:hypothetical protein
LQIGINRSLQPSTSSVAIPKTFHSIFHVDTECI